MKSFYTLLILLIPFVGFGQKTYVPNNIFEMYLETNGMGDGFINNDSVLTENILSINELNLSGYGITDFTGLEDFISLEYFNCNNNSYNGILDLSANIYLKELICSNQGVNELILTNNDSLENLVCYDNSLSELNLENNINLKYLDCEDNNISSLNLSNCTALEYLDCSDNGLLTLNINGLYELEDGKITNNISLYCIEVDSPLFFENILQYNFFTFFSSDCENLIYGCIDEQSCNFDENATVNDGSCNYPSSSELFIQSCENIEWNEMLLAETGLYSYVTINSNGCDSTVIIDLIIFESISDNIIIGNPEPDPFSVSLYSASNNENNLIWSVEGGNIIENNGNSINIEWGNQGIGLITLIESNDICDDFTNVFTVNIGGQIEPTWDCNNDYACVELSDGSGNFQSLEECETNCNPIEDSWNCVNDACIDPQDGTGIYSSLNDCEQVCQSVLSIYENDFNVNIYPNPSSNIFNLEFSSDTKSEILVTNILGEQVYFESNKSVGEFITQIDLSNYSKGIYNLTIKTSDGISNHKLILQ
jgi:hypothetical protein